MAIRNIRKWGDPVLNKKAKEVKEITPKLELLIKDMFDTMYQAEGVGLAAPQVGILKQVITIDISEEKKEPIVLINPVILETSGEQKGYEGCLSIPGKSGIVTRPDYVKVEALNEKFEKVILEGEGFLARAFCHEIEHLEGHLYVEKIEGKLLDNEELERLRSEEN